ncbi:MAG: TIGR04283 family arsenosugar biosynthesis glycosyltransferase [Halieaceae bacterium]|jgi:rSAM/selenodomain-associated transferase 2|nr:TIGR04283 family arsenosugar biosynthesis glycosyltransferase [Halieaceae bacterium]
MTAPEPPTASPPLLSIIVPVLDEADILEALFDSLQPWRDMAEIIVVDGGSADDSARLSRRLADRVLQGERGRARQQNTGAAAARGDYLLFLHADCRLRIAPEVFCRRLAHSPRWGFFDVRLSGSHPLLRIVEMLMCLRSRTTRVATGDQCLFVARPLFASLGGFADIPLMEDVELCKRLRRIDRPAVQGPPVLTSSRRWERHGVIRTVLLMWNLRLRFWLGESADSLHRRYYSR